MNLEKTAMKKFDRFETRLRWFREVNKISLSELAKSSGIAEATLSKLERRLADASPAIRAKLNNDFGGEAENCDWLLSPVTLREFLAEEAQQEHLDNLGRKRTLYPNLEH